MFGRLTSASHASQRLSIVRPIVIARSASRRRFRDFDRQVYCDEHAHYQTHRCTPHSGTGAHGAGRHTRAADRCRGGGSTRVVRATEATGNQRQRRDVDEVVARLLSHKRKCRRCAARSRIVFGGSNGCAVRSDGLLRAARRSRSLDAKSGADAAAASSATADADDAAQSADAPANVQRRAIAIASSMEFIDENRREHVWTHSRYCKGDG